MIFFISANLWSFCHPLSNMNPTPNFILLYGIRGKVTSLPTHRERARLVTRRDWISECGSYVTALKATNINLRRSRDPANPEIKKSKMRITWGCGWGILWFRRILWKIIYNFYDLAILWFFGSKNVKKPKKPEKHGDGASDTDETRQNSYCLVPRHPPRGRPGNDFYDFLNRH